MNSILSSIDTNVSLFYSGRSMNGTFKPGDKLFIKKIFSINSRKGDVLVIKIQNTNAIEKQVVHRLVIGLKNTLITRGDNNPKNDDEPVNEENLVGKVTHYERNGKIHKAWNGKLGMLRARVLHARLHILRIIKLFLRKPYRMLKKTGIIANFWRPEIETIYFDTQEGPLVKYVRHGRTVASCWTKTNRWWFRRPYDFVIKSNFRPEQK